MTPFLTYLITFASGAVVGFIVAVYVVKRNPKLPQDAPSKL